MKRYLFLAIIGLCNVLGVRSDDNIWTNYFYPNGRVYKYSWHPDTSHDLFMMAPFKAEYQIVKEGNISYLQKKILYKENLLDESKYYLVEDGSDRVVSYTQFYENALFPATKDSLVLFALPNDTSSRVWVEEDRKTLVECVSEYVYIRIGYHCHKVIKITKKSKVKTENGDSNAVEWSYWEKNRGKIASFSSVDSSEPMLSELLEGWESTITEVSKQDYEQYLLSEYYKRMYPLALEDFLDYDVWRSLQRRLTDVAVDYIPVTKPFKEYYNQSWFGTSLGEYCKIEIRSLNDIKISIKNDCFKAGIEDTIRAILIETLENVPLPTGIHPITNNEEYRALTCNIDLRFNVHCERFVANYEKKLDYWYVGAENMTSKSYNESQVNQKLENVIKDYCALKKKTPKNLLFKAIIISSCNRSGESYIFMTDLK